MLLTQRTAVRIDLNVIKTGMAEHLRIYMAAAITPEVKLTTLNAERNLTAITENDSRDFPATCTGSVFVIYHDHDLDYHMR